MNPTPPIASHYLRKAIAENDMAAFADLMSHQFFEVADIWGMAEHSIAENRTLEGLAGGSFPPLSERLFFGPAKKFWLETPAGFALACSEIEGGLAIRTVTRQRISRQVHAFAGSSDMKIEPGQWVIDGMHEAECAALYVEALLCIINQPGLIEGERKPMDRRIQKRAKFAGKGEFALWVKCKIKPGRHGTVKEHGGEGFAKPLHYVRKHLKPKASAKAGRNIYIDGYWRGDADIGVLLKTYSPEPPKQYWKAA